METKELRQRVFALYIGAEMQTSNSSGEVNVYTLQHVTDKHYILLTPLSGITDEDKTELLKILSNGRNEIGINCSINPDELGMNEWRYFNHFAVDFLRRKGYATPCYGKSVEELVNLGIVKLKDK